MSTATLDAPPEVAPPAKKPEAPWPGQQWEYRTFRLSLAHQTGAPLDGANTLAAMNALGEAGWEVVGSGVSRDGRTLHCILKRPRPEAGKRHNQKP